LEKIIQELESIEHWLLVQKLSKIIEGQGAVGMAVQTTSVSLTFMLHLEHEAWTNIQVSAFL
jgi:hypothetical protein